MDQPYHIYWGDSHHNTYQQSVQDPPMDDILAGAATYLDFYSGAYYTPIFVAAECGGQEAAIRSGGGHPQDQAATGSWKGINLERLKDRAVLDREWAEFQAATAAHNRPGRFVTFPGYEWQGNGREGDHNVIFRAEGAPLAVPETLRELYDAIRAADALAIPHHTGYRVTTRAPDWRACDERLTPYAELFSVHGCSETDEEWIGLRRNSHMGPGVGGGTWQDALDAGLHLGAICSTDNWTNMPGHWGQGLMACLAPALTRDALWSAFRARRVYGVTGDRIAIDFTVNGAPMGSILPAARRRAIRIAVRGADAIDRIELLRNGRVIATHNHQGAWDYPPAGRRARFKLRIEPGWGPRAGELPLPEQTWEGALTVDGGRLLAWEPCWVTRGQGVPELDRATARFRMVSRQDYVMRESQGATVFEFEADPAARLSVTVNGQERAAAVGLFAQRSRLLWYRNECVDLIARHTGVKPESAGRGDAFFHMAGKVKLHRIVPESGYTASLEFDDDEPFDREIHYRIRVEQRNGQRAWSSPVWFGAPGREPAPQPGEGTAP